MTRVAGPIAVPDIMQPFQLPLILADLEQIIGAVIGLFLLVMWVINQIRDAKKQAPAPRNQQPPPQQPPPKQRQPQPRGQAAAAAGQAGPANQQADPLREQVQEFLRRTQQQQGPQEQRPPQRPVQRPPGRRELREIEVLVPEERPDDERRTIAEPFRPMQSPAASRPVPAGRPRPTAEPSHGSVSGHVTDHLGASPVGWQASKLGQRIIADDEQFDVQLKAKFDHSVGTLASIRLSDLAPAQAPLSDSPASQLAVLLASPAGVRQAIILNEILRRPTDRW